MASQPLVSIITIFLNEEDFLEEAITSVLAQTYGGWELLLVDDGSTDGSTQIAKRWAEREPERIRYLDHHGHANKGMSASRNLGLRNAHGRYLALLDGDDAWLPSKLERQVPILCAEPHVGMLYGATEYWYSWTNAPSAQGRDYLWQPGFNPPVVFNPPELLTHFLDRTVLMPCSGSILVRREAVDQIGGWEDAFRGLYEDWVFFAKLCVNVPIMVGAECLDRYRQHPRSACAATDAAAAAAARRAFLDWLARYLSERGLAEGVGRPALQTTFRAES